MRRFLAIGILAGLLAAWWQFAIAQQASIIPRSGVAPDEVDTTYTRIKNYLAQPSNRLFQIVSDNPTSRTLVFKRSAIDSETWSSWAICNVETAHLLDTLEESAATVTLNVTPSASHTSLVKVSAEFDATYALGSLTTDVACVSKGALENQILAAAGVPTTASGSSAP
jgi:hypothetical protein